MKIVNVRELTIPAIKVISFARFSDMRGYFTESGNVTQLLEIVGEGFQVRQINESFSHKGVVRGLHFQWSPYMGKMVRVIRGRMLDLILDIRSCSETYGKAIAYEMSSSPEGNLGEWIWIPPGFAHGNAFLEDTLIEYFCTCEYNPKSEGCISPLAPDIDWSLSDSRSLAKWEQVNRSDIIITSKDRIGMSVHQWHADKASSSANFSFSSNDKVGARGTVLVTGGSGLLGRELKRVLPPGTIFPTRGEFDITNMPQMHEFLDGKNVGVVIHAAAFTSPAKVALDPVEALRVNIKGTSNIAEICSRRALKLVYISTDYVFAGTSGMYREGDAVLPQNQYAWSKLAGECAAQLCKGSVVVRLSFGPTPFPHAKAFKDQWTSRVSAREAAAQVARLLPHVGSIQGPIHLGGPRRSVLDYAKSLDPAREIEGASIADVTSVRLPQDTSLDVSRFERLVTGAGGEAGSVEVMSGSLPGSGRDGRVRACVIGGAGYIGSRVCQELAQAGGVSVTIVDALWYGMHVPAGSYDCLVRADYRDLDAALLRRFDVVVLLAGHSSVKMCHGALRDSFSNNVARHVDLLDKLERASAGGRIKLIYASSSSVYGDADGARPVDERYPIVRPNNLYDLSKLCIDLYSAQSRVEWYGLRFGTVCGASPNLRRDVMLNAMVADSLTAGEVRLYVKHVRRPVLGIKDLCRAVASVIGHSEDRRGVYNLASFNGTVEQYGAAVARRTGVPIKYLTVEQVEEMTNVKLQSKQYDFAIDSSRFCGTFAFEFRETVDSIITELQQAFPFKHAGTRNHRRSAL